MALRFTQSLICILISAGAAWGQPPTSLYKTERAPTPPLSPGKTAFALDARARARLLMEEGEKLVTKDDMSGAAAEFRRALELNRKAFSHAERLRMATVISWADQLALAAQELEYILKENQEDIAARINLARVLAWDGKTDAAIAQAEQALKRSPENSEALLVKANAMRWGGDARGPVAIYRKILAKGDDFEARLGLAHALLANNDIKGAREQANLLKAQYPNQQKEQKRLAESVKRASETTLSVRYGHYGDRDGNHADRYTLTGEGKLGNFDMAAAYTHVDARNSNAKNSGEELYFSGFGMVNDFLGAGVGVGMTRMTADDSANFLTWHGRANLKLVKGELGASIARETLTDTAELLAKRIRVLAASVSMEQKLTDRFTLAGEFARRQYSDDNSSLGVIASLRYTLIARNPALGVGYRFRFLNFEKNSGGGYFDPQDFVSHQAFLTLNHEFKPVTLSVSPFAGRQSFVRNNSSNADWVWGVSGTAGYQVASKVRLEGTGEFGNFALGSVTGFRYFQLGIKGNVSF